MNKILIIGNTCVDVIITVDHLPRTAEDVQPSSQSFSLGGCPFNAANIVRQAQVPFLFMTPVGTGMYGNYVHSHLTELGFPIPIRSEKENGCCYCLVEASGERTFLSYHGVEYTFQKEWMSSISTSDFNIAYICGLEIEEPTGEQLISYLEEHRIPNIFFAPGPRLMMIPKERRDRIFALHPILHINEEEAYALSGSHEIEQAAHILRSITSNTVIITLGAQGSCFLEQNADSLVFVPGIPAKVTDTIGAGDSHIGQIMASRAQGKSWKTALTEANYVSSYVVSVKGASLSDEQYQSISAHFCSDDTQ